MFVDDQRTANAIDVLNTVQLTQGRRTQSQGGKNYAKGEAAMCRVQQDDSI